MKYIINISINVENKICEYHLIPTNSDIHQPVSHSTDCMSNVRVNRSTHIAWRMLQNYWMCIVFIFHSALLPVVVDLRHGNFSVLLLVGNHSLTAVHPLLMNNVLAVEHWRNMTLCATNQSHAAMIRLLTAVSQAFWGITVLSQGSEVSAANHAALLWIYYLNDMR